MKSERSHFSFVSDGSVKSTGSDPDQDVAKYGARELTAIPYLISKGHFHEVERMARIAIKSQRLNEGRVHIFPP